MKSKVLYFVLFAIYTPLVFSQQMEILTNHLGYEFDAPKRFVLKADNKDTVNPEKFYVVDAVSDENIFTGNLTSEGKVKNWKNWVFWSGDFSAVKQKGEYYIKVFYKDTVKVSFPFSIDENLLEKKTLSDVIYYFKGQRSSGLYDKADSHILLTGHTTGEVDAHGGWYDATGDYGKHLSHLTFSTYFNPQQISLTAWSLFKTYRQLEKRGDKDFRQFKRRILDEAMYGADFLVRMHVENGSFYRSITAPGPEKLPRDREIQPEAHNYTIKENKDETFSKNEDGSEWRSFQTSYRSGGGVSIAALAMASTYKVSGEFRNAEYLKVAEQAFAFLEKENVKMTNDGKENMLDDFTALCAATELYRATEKEKYHNAATRRANSILNRLTSWKSYKNYWSVDEGDRPFFHPSDAGFPIVSLLEFYPLADAGLKRKIKSAIKGSLEFELNITAEVTNPFGYSRQLVQDTLGHRKSAFFFPHNTEASPWWQGENARLGSMAAAAKSAMSLFSDDTVFQEKLMRFATDQLNWILGLNPYNACMLEGSGYNNPQYEFFGTFEYTNAPGGIVNGITGGYEENTGIDFNLSYKKTGKDNDWRWLEQWLPHAAWYMYAVSLE
ncbi:glycoside hydrolase family 9 protein [Sinomicrobium weinanense]|uniref:Glycoside hydrolase family 9 protein n=1 Tax=Sinomicrobium weinanense TaxID=2842200 RepID=A0A926JPW9_9FLAO|nr:glycoside hydrolase family 9 protein [Sinomicrobium weinanense]MBC9795302.1 glycoside hydrolase family 9 protein [Sinomicrobium weinanense]MBU3125774.1 glycoside hydrolase family 9 protein [Sinomicrobium weinanense]